METITFIYKNKVEQFKEQFPELYLEIYNVGYTDGRSTEQYQYDDENPAEFDESMGPDDNASVIDECYPHLVNAKEND